MNTKFEGKYIDLELVDGILIGTYKKNIKINLEVAKEIVYTRLNFTNQVPYPAMVVNQGVISMDKAARDFLSSAAGVEGILAGAIIIDSVFTSYLGNFYLQVSRPKIPSRIFTSKSDAMQWLQQFKNK